MTMTTKLQQFIDEFTPKINETLESLLTQSTIPETLHESMLYSIRAGGKEFVLYSFWRHWKI